MKSENEIPSYPSFQKESSTNHIGIAPPIIEETVEVPENKAYQIFGSCMVDNSGRQFACIHENCDEFSNCLKSELSQNKIDFHPDDRAVLCEEAFPDILRFVEDIPVTELPDYRLLFNHRYIRKDGSVSQFLHEGCLTHSHDQGITLLDLKLFTEIGDFKTDETIVLAIFKYSSDQGYQKVYSKIYGTNGNSSLSHREMEIIRLCLDGLSSKMIADKLNLSIHTVKNHKRNCMEKTLTHNITELIHLCMTNHWL